MSDDLRHPPWVRGLHELLVALPALVSDRLELLALELQRAGRSLVQILVLIVAAAMLGATAWLALCGGLGLALVALGLAWPAALGVVLVANVALAWAALTRLRGLLANLGLPATRRHLVFGAEAATAAGEALARQPLAGTSGGRR